MAIAGNNELFEQGLAQHQAGQLSSARAAYQQVLAREPTHADALHMLGVLSGQEGRPDIAIDLIQRALQAKADYPEAWSNLGLTFSALGRFDEAVNALRRAAALQPSEAIVHFHLAEALNRSGRSADAQRAY